VTCRRCSECEGMSHHWTPDPMATDDPDYLPGDYACKHCEQRGNVCEHCYEEGCVQCEQEGVVPLSTAEMLAGIIMARWDEWEALAGQTSQQEQDAEAGEGELRSYLVGVIEEIYPASVAAHQ
jgi:hypothetical protein